MATQPAGTVTFLFSDVEGSTRLLERLGRERYAEALELHRRLLREAFDHHAGYEVDCEGDAFFVAFPSAGEALAAAAEAQQALAAAEWPAEGDIRVRMGLHTGEPLLVPPKYVGLDVHKAARIMAAGHGGQVLFSEATRRLLEGVESISLGEHRLKDLLQAEPLHQLRIEGLPSEFPALKTLGNRPNNLPDQPNALIGREREVAEVAALLSRNDVRLLTLTGPGGIGKTRLALQAAAELLDQFADGVYFVALAPTRDASLVIPTIAQAVAVRERPGQPLPETLAEHLADKSLLLLLDNLEQIRPAGREVAAMLRASPTVKVLATSRAPLHVAAEHLYSVPPLTLPDPTDLPDADALRGIETIRLFIERAQAVRLDFALTAENAPVIAEVCARLDGLPLAIELAAARARVLSPQALLARLDRRLRLLTGGGDDLDERQQTLRGTIAWSFDLLSESEQFLFARLGIFVGGCRLDAAEDVCDPDRLLAIEILDGTASLVEKSLLHQREDADGEPRFLMLETIREFARDRLQESGTAPAVSERHARHFLRFAEERAAEYAGPRQSQWLEWLDAEQANMRAALAYFIEHDRAEELAVLAIGLSRWWYLRGHLREGRDLLQRILEREHELPPSIRGKVLHEAVVLTHRTGDYEKAAALAERSLALAGETDDVERIPEALLATSLMAYSLGNDSRAIGDLDACIAAATSTGNDRVLAMAHANRGDLEMGRAKYAAATRHFEASLELFQNLGDERAVGLTLANLGLIAVRRGHDREASRLLGEALSLAERLSDKESTLWCLGGLSAIAARSGNAEAAARILGLVRRLREETGHVPQRDERELETVTIAQLQASLGAEKFASTVGAGEQGHTAQGIAFAQALARDLQST
jgi:predicted ATPase/class 3 adenylate cyclase